MAEFTHTTFKATAAHEGKDQYKKDVIKNVDITTMAGIVPLVESMAALVIADAAMIQLGRDGSKQDEPVQKKRKL